MKYFSIDVETTGTNPELDQIIEFGAVFEDPNIQHEYEDIPKFKRIIKHERYSGSAVAISMNARIFDILSTYDRMEAGEAKNAFKLLHGIITIDQLVAEFHEFIVRCYYENYKLFPPVKGINVVGKNFGNFDSKFIARIPHIEHVPIYHTIADPSMSYVHWYKDETFPSLSVCKTRAGFNAQVSHNALEDAWDVVSVCRKQY